MENCPCKRLLPEKSIDKPMGAYYNVLAVYNIVVRTNPHTWRWDDNPSVTATPCHLPLHKGG